MATTSEVFCDICAAQDKTNPAIKWCPECEEALCVSCTKHHSISKLSKNHTAIEISDYKKIPDFVSNIKQTCEDHQERYQIFCTFHDTACCVKCVLSNHKDCKGLVPITDILENAKTSSYLQDVEEILVELRENIRMLITNRTQNLKNVQSQIEKAKDLVKETRDKLNKHLDKLEKDLITDIKQKESEIQNATQKVLKDLEDKDFKVKENQENLKTIKAHGTNIQTFNYTREVLKFAEREEKCVKNYFEDGNLNNTNFKFQLNDGISKCLTADKFGYLSVTTTTADVKPVQIKIKAAQLGTLPSKTKSIDDIKVVLSTKFRVASRKSNFSITGCDVTADGTLVIADCYNMRILIHSIEGAFYIGKINIPYHAYDVSVIDNQTVAVSSAGYRHIVVVDISTNKITKDIEADDYCYGIVYMDGKVISTINKYGLVSYGIEDRQPTTVRKDDLINWSYITCFMDKIYYTNTTGNSVTCLNSKGEHLWTVTDTTLISAPRSIATDRHGNIYVSSQGNNSIVVISSDKKRVRKILDQKDGINKAFTLCCYKMKNQLVVVNWSGDVFVFDII